jgi:hypothetical protein
MSFTAKTEEHLEQLHNAGIDVAATQSNCQLELATKSGLRLASPRLIANAELGLEDWSSVNVWIEHETRLNEMLPGYDDPVICTYHANLLNGTIDILRTDPVAVIGGLLYKNSFFMPPKPERPLLV